MDNITINPKFQTILSLLTDEEFNQLEEAILERGCESPIVIWRGQIIDGHNRYEICTRHDKDFKTIDRTFDFADEESVIEWIYINQLGRRNLNPNQKLLYIGELYELRKKRHGDVNRVKPNEFPSGHFDHLGESEIVEPVFDDPLSEEIHTEKVIGEAEIVYDEYSQVVPETDVDREPEHQENGQDDDLNYELDPQFQRRQPKKPSRTRSIIAKEFGVSPRTVQRASKIAKAVELLPAEDRKTFTEGKMTQTAILEKVQERANPNFTPEPDDPTRDEFTATAARLSKKLHTSFGEINAAITAAKLEFFDKNQNFDEWCPHLAGLNLDIVMIDVKQLKSLRVCKYCGGKKCPLCHETGYVTGAHHVTTVTD